MMAPSSLLLFRVLCEMKQQAEHLVGLLLQHCVSRHIGYRVSDCHLLEPQQVSVVRIGSSPRSLGKGSQGGCLV